MRHLDFSPYFVRFARALLETRMPRTTIGLVVRCAALACVLAGLFAQTARAQTEQQALVDRATLTVQEMLTPGEGKDARSLLRRAHGAMICPRVFKAAFLIGGGGGSCVMVGRVANGWTGPAFYGMGGGGIGFQAGLTDSEVIIIVLTEKGLRALLDSQFKFGASADLAIATLGAGVQGATSAGFNADIVSYSRSRGLFAGVSLEGSLISSRSDWNQIYYGRPLAAQQIVLENGGNNPAAAPLRETLARFSGE
jgi:SH3 domain-containing YSC84-like protein 1